MNLKQPITKFMWLIFWLAVLALILMCCNGCATARKAWDYTGTPAFPRIANVADKLSTIIVIQDPDIVESNASYGNDDLIEIKLIAAGYAIDRLFVWGSKGERGKHWAIQSMNRVAGVIMLVTAGANVSLAF